MKKGIAIIFSFLALAGVARAYSLNTTATAPHVTTTAKEYLNQANNIMHSTSALPTAPSWLSHAITSVENWFASMTAQGGQSTRAPQIELPGGAGGLNAITGNVQHAFSNFDAWFAGIFHFHIAPLFNLIFGVVIWILSLAQGIVAWLASLFK